MKVSINNDECTGCNLCVDTCPDMFEMEGDIAKVKKADVPADQAETTKQAAEDCPVEAIIIEE